MNQLPWYVIGAVSQTVTRVPPRLDFTSGGEPSAPADQWESSFYSGPACMESQTENEKEKNTLADEEFKCIRNSHMSQCSFLGVFFLLFWLNIFIYFLFFILFFCTQFMSVTVFHIWFGSVFRKAFQWATGLQEFLLILTTLVSRIATSITFQFNQDRFVSEWMKSEKSRLLYIFTVTQHIQ